MGRSLQPRCTLALRAACIAALALVAAGCGNGGEQQRIATAKPTHTKTEMQFLAQYEKLRTQACPTSTKRCQVAVARPTTAAAASTAAYSVCIQHAVKNIPQPSPPKGVHGKAQLNAWMTGNTTAMLSAIEACDRRYGNATLGDARAYGYGAGWNSSYLPGSTFDSIANMTGEPVDVVIN